MRAIKAHWPYAPAGLACGRIVLLYSGWLKPTDIRPKQIAGTGGPNRWRALEILREAFGLIADECRPFDPADFRATNMREIRTEEGPE